MPTTHKKCASSWIEPGTRETKVERFIPSRLGVIDIRQITECDPNCQLTARPPEIKLMRKHFAVGKGLVMIRAENARCARNRRNACSKERRQKNRDSHATNSERGERSSSTNSAHRWPPPQFSNGL